MKAVDCGPNQGGCLFSGNNFGLEAGKIKLPFGRLSRYNELASQQKRMKGKPICMGCALLMLLMGLLLPPPAVRAAGADSPPPLSQYGIETWDGSDGLPHIRIRAIVQTRDGYLWLGTANGLVRFDGDSFTTFDVGTGSLKDNEISGLVEDNDRALWIGTYGGGLTRLKDGQFTTFTTADGLPDNLIRKVDKDPAGNIWFATPRGVGHFASGSFTTFTSREGLPNNYISSICASSSRGIFAVSGGRLYHLNNGRFTMETAAMDDSDGRMDSMASDSAGAIWMTFETSRIKRWKDGQATTYTTWAGRKINRPGPIYEDQLGSIWFGTRDGLLRFHDGTFDALTTSEAQAKLGLVLSMFTDREGNLWLGTEANGLARLRSVAVKMLTAEDGLSESSTRCVYRDQRGDIWIGSYMGFTRVSHGKVTAFTQMDGDPIPTVTSIGEDAAGRIWIAAGGRLYVMENDRLTPVAGWKKVFDIKVIASDGRGDMWIGTDGDGLFRFSDGKMTAFQVKDGLAGNQIRAIFSDRQGALWVGTTGGLSRYQDGKFTTFTASEGLPDYPVMSLCEDADGVLWIGTRGGLSRYQDGHFYNIGVMDGLPNKYIFNVLDDGQGNFWLSTASGICHVRRADLNALAAGKIKKIEPVSLGYRDGLRAASLIAGTQPNACVGDDGQLLFCSMKGLVMVSPVKQAANRQIPPVYIEQVLINKQEKPVDRSPELSAGPCEIEIHYTALSFVAPEKVQFKYRLDPIDAGWVDAGQRRFAHYASLPPGTYRFQVIACNNDGVWNWTGASYLFNLPPRFYQTIWFLTLMLLALAALTGGGYALKIHRLRVHERELQRRVDESVAQVKVLSGLLPICSGCKKIRDDKGYWNQIEGYIMKHAEVEFSHSLCPDCIKRLYPDEVADLFGDPSAGKDEKKFGPDKPSAGPV
jgi:ligand-binding sensor domain-containing protein